MSDPFLLTAALNAVGAIAVLVLWGFPSIFLHEFGHTLAAKLLRLKPTHLVVGESDPIFSSRAFGVDIIVRLIPIGGLTLIETPPTNRLKAFLFIAAGPVSNALVILCAFRLWPQTSMKAILATVILVEIVQVIHNLIPASMIYEGVEIPRDGKRLLQILSGRLS